MLVVYPDSVCIVRIIRETMFSMLCGILDILVLLHWSLAMLATLEASASKHVVIIFSLHLYLKVWVNDLMLCRLLIDITNSATNHGLTGYSRDKDLQYLETIATRPLDHANLVYSHNCYGVVH